MHHERRRCAKPTAAAMIALLVAATALVTAQPAAARAVPKGAAWYTTYRLPQAWKVSEGAGVTVAVIDSRVETTVGDLQGQTVAPVNLAGANPDYETSTGYSHGTDMAVKIAGSGAGGGMVGVAPQAKILPIDVDNSTHEGDPDLINAAIRAAVDRGAKVINLSLGAVGACDKADAIRYAYEHGVIVVAAAGDSPGPVSSPANCPGALAVGGVDATGKPWTQTPSGPEIDFVSQSYNLVNEQLNGTLGGPYPGNSGTSTAAAFVSGMFALLISHFPHDSTRRIVARALYWTHTGRGIAGIDKRVDNYLGYGELLPYQSLTGNTPADAANPIFDEWDRALGSPTGSASPSTSGSASNPSAGSSATAGPTPTTSPTASASGGAGNGISPALVAVIVVVAIATVGSIVLVVLRSRTPKGPSGYPPAPPPGYPPAPPGYGR